MGAKEKRPAAENIATAISGFHGINQVKASEAGQGIRAARTGESEKTHGGLKLPLVGPDPHHGRLDFPLFQSDERHFRADRTHLQSAVTGDGLKELRVRLDEPRGGPKMTAVESDASEIRSAARVVRLDERHFQSGVPLFQSAAPRFQSDEPLVLPNRSHGRLDERQLRLNQQKVEVAVSQVLLNMMLFRPKQSRGGLKVWRVESDVPEIQSAVWRFQSKASLFRLFNVFLRFETAVLSTR